MSNILSIIADNPDELLNAGAYGAGAVIRLQTAATEAGAYADVAGTGSTPTLAIVAGDRIYTGYDPAGITTSWYRTRFENAGGTRVSDWSAAFQVIQTPGMLCTVGQVKARVSPDGTWTEDDAALISEMIVECSAWIESYTGRSFVPEDGATYVFDTHYGQSLWIARGIRTVTSMGVNNSAHQPDTGGSYTTLAAGDVLLRPQAGDLPGGWPPTEVRISRASTTVPWFGNVENGCTITGDFGFAAVPADIEAVAIDAVVAAYQSRRNGASSVMGAEDFAMPPWNRFFGRGSPQRGTLDRYRFVSV